MLCHAVRFEDGFKNNSSNTCSYNRGHRKRNVLYYVCTAVFTLVAGLLAISQYSEGLPTGHFGTDFLGFPVSISKC